MGENSVEKKPTNVVFKNSLYFLFKPFCYIFDVVLRKKVFGCDVFMMYSKNLDILFNSGHLNYAFVTRALEIIN